MDALSKSISHLAKEVALRKISENRARIHDGAEITNAVSAEANIAELTELIQLLGTATNICQLEPVVERICRF